MTRLERVIEAIKASRIGKNCDWIYEDGKISDKVICFDMVEFLEELKPYEINVSDDYVDKFKKDAYNFYSYNVNAPTEKAISIWYHDGKNNNPVLIIYIHLYGDARRGFSEPFAVNMESKYPFMELIGQEFATQCIDLDDTRTADVTFTSETYNVYDNELQESIGEYFGIEKEEVLGEMAYRKE